MLGELFRQKKGESPDRDALRELLESGIAELDGSVAKILLNVIDLQDWVVREIMVPRIDMVTVLEGSTRDEVLETIRRYGHSRIPVIAGDADTVIGILYAKDLLTEETPKKGAGIRALSREVFFVPETKPVLALLNDFRSRRIHLAIVVDEYGGVSGLVSLEDILEIFVGDILDEYDDDQVTIKKTRRGEWSIDPRETVYNVNQACGSSLPADQADTLGGLFMELYGSLPEKGAFVSSAGYRISVLALRDNRILRLHLRKERRSSAAHHG